MRSDRFNPRAREGRDWAPRLRPAQGLPVSTHAPARGATASPCPVLLPCRFNPRAREGRDFPVMLCLPTLGRVSTHAPARGATTRFYGTVRDSRQFQPTRPRGGATAPPWCHPPFEPCFNPRAREGRDDPKGRSPTIPGGVSTHAPARGATAVPSWPCQRQPGFNPRAREGRDGPEHHGLPGGLHVSTHAPARGATPATSIVLVYRFVSTHAPARGATASRRRPPSGMGQFQPTRPRGARPATSDASGLSARFQPTRPRGARLADDTWVTQTSFQPTRPRGARPPTLATALPILPSFNPRAREGATLRAQIHDRIPRGFNPRAREGRDGPSCSAVQHSEVSTTRPRGARRQDLPGNATAMGGFNPRAREGRDHNTAGEQDHEDRFNPRAREGRDCVVLQCATPHRSVSTQRAREGRATGPGQGEQDPRRRFNPRAREGRDGQRLPRPPRRKGFNPRAREGRDRAGRLYLHRRPGVSTHAPARGATRNKTVLFQRHPRFNPRAREGRDVSPEAAQAYLTRFQPTRPRGARPDPRCSRRHGSAVSTHAPARGATPWNTARPCPARSFNHAPARGATARCATPSSPSSSFNPRAREGRDIRIVRPRNALLEFQPTRPRGARPVILVWAQADTNSFNPRAREGRDRPA